MTDRALTPILPSATLRTAAAVALAAAALGTGLALAPSSSAQGGAAVRSAGTCSAHGHWTLEAKPDNGRIEVEAEVDVNRAGVHWTWTLSHDGVTVRRGSATTTAPSGSFGVHRRPADRPGTHRVVFAARNPANGNSCRGSVVV